MQKLLYLILALMLSSIFALADEKELGDDLVAAAEAGDVARIAELLAQGVPIEFHSKKHDDMTALIGAARKEKAEAVKFLLGRCARQCCYRAGKYGALLCLRCQGRRGLTLLAAGANPNLFPSGGESPVYMAAEKGKELICRQLLDAGANPNLAKTAFGSALHRAIGNNDEIVSMLLAKKADLSVEDHDGNTSLTYAILFHQKFAELILRRGADINATNHTEKLRGCEPAGKVIMTVWIS